MAICPCCDQPMSDDIDSTRCWICGFREWKAVSIDMPMDYQTWRDYGTVPRVTIADKVSTSGVQRPRKICTGCGKLKVMQTKKLCWKCDDREKKGRPFIGDVKHGRPERQISAAG